MLADVTSPLEAITLLTLPTETPNNALKGLVAIF
jgi:hypothetical protein